MKLKTLMSLMALVVITACSPTTPEAIASSTQAAMDRGARTQQTLEASESPNMAFVPPPSEYQVASATVPAGLSNATNQQAVPADSTEYQVDLVEMTQAINTRDPGRFVSLPSTFKNGYPVFAATCIFNPGEAECTLADGEVVDEAYLAAHTTVIRNIDVLGLTCGTICVDEDGNVLGHVSKEMIAWRDRNCTWVDYGTPSCK